MKLSQFVIRYHITPAPDHIQYNSIISVILQFLCIPFFLNINDFFLNIPPSLVLSNKATIMYSV